MSSKIPSSGGEKTPTGMRGTNPPEGGNYARPSTASQKALEHGKDKEKVAQMQRDTIYPDYKDAHITGTSPNKGDTSRDTLKDTLPKDTKRDTSETTAKGNIDKGKMYDEKSGLRADQKRLENLSGDKDAQSWIRAKDIVTERPKGTQDQLDASKTMRDRHPGDRSGLPSTPGDYKVAGARAQPPGPFVLERNDPPSIQEFEEQEKIRRRQEIRDDVQERENQERRGDRINRDIYQRERELHGGDAERMTERQRLREDRDKDKGMLSRDIGGVSEIPKESSWMKTNLHLVALDNSQQSEFAFRWALRHLPKDDRLVLYNGLPQVPYIEGPIETSSPDLETMEEMQRTQRKDRKALMRRYLQECKKADRVCIEATSHKEYYSTTALSKEICGMAKDLKAKSVVCGSRGYSGVGGALMGSVSSKLVDNCECSVVVVRPKDKDGKEAELRKFH